MVVVPLVGYLVVVHDGVHTLDPDRVDVPVQDDPLHVLVQAERSPLLAHVPHDDGQDPVLPLLGQRHIAVQLVGRDGLRAGKTKVGNINDEDNSALW